MCVCVCVCVVGHCLTACCRSNTLASASSTLALSTIASEGGREGGKEGTSKEKEGKEVREDRGGDK